MNNTFSALNGVIDDRCFLNKLPAIENEHSDFDVVMGIPNTTLAIAASFGKLNAFFFQKFKIFSSVNVSF